MTTTRSPKTTKTTTDHVRAGELRPGDYSADPRSGVLVLVGSIERLEGNRIRITYDARRRPQGTLGITVDADRIMTRKRGRLAPQR